MCCVRFVELLIEKRRRLIGSVIDTITPRSVDRLAVNTTTTTAHFDDTECHLLIHNERQVNKLYVFALGGILLIYIYRGLIMALRL